MYILGMSATPGSWISPISAKLLTNASTVLSGLQALGDDILWAEMRPTESGRTTIISKNHGELLQAPWDASSGVHEYGGSAWIPFVADGSSYIAFVNKSDQRIYTFAFGEMPIPITPETEGAHRYAEMIYVDGEIWCVREIVEESGKTERALVAVTQNGVKVLHNQVHFYAYLKVSPDKKRAAFIGWDHPRMPWNGTELFIADIENGALENVRVLEGDTSTSILSPIWASNNRIYYISDASGWWNPWQIDLNGEKKQLINEPSEWAGPLWRLGLNFLEIHDSGNIIGVHGPVENQRIAMLNPLTGQCTDIESDFNHFSPDLAVSGDHLFTICAGTSVSQALIDIDLHSKKVCKTLFKSELQTSVKYLSKLYAIEVLGKKDRKIFAMFHPANNPEVIHSGPTPLIVAIHGGPTGNSSASLNLEFNYFTSRGIAVVDVNHGGSTGYGRDFRRTLNGAWGVIDLEDCISVAEHLIETGFADPEKILVRGGSAGGFTALSALVHSKLFAAGASYYGISNLETFASETHDFESHYCESLVGPLPEKRNLYIERSPISFADNLSSPVILFHGLDDKVVPPNQSRTLRDACIRNGIKHELHEYSGEGHGFDKAENQIHSIEHELNFYGEVLGFTPMI